MRDDTTTTAAEPADVLNAQLEAFRAHPDDDGLFRELRDQLEVHGRTRELAELFELRAAREPDPERAARTWTQAGMARLALGEDGPGLQDLERAVGLDPSLEEASAPLVARLLERRKFARAAEIIERELDALDALADTEPASAGAPASASAPTRAAVARRRAQRHRELARLWEDHLGRVDRALHHWQRAWQLEPDNAESLEAARAIYASLGDEAMVARLYEAELDVLGDDGPRARRAEIELALGRIAARRGAHASAAEHLERALSLSPRLPEAAEALADAYAAPEFADSSKHLVRAGELYVGLGQDRLAEGDTDAAIAFLRRALGVDPDSQVAAAALDETLAGAERWEELDSVYAQWAEHCAPGSPERHVLLAKRAQLHHEQLDDRATLKQILAELAAGSPPHSEPSRLLRRLYREDGDWAELAALIEAELPALEGDPARPTAQAAAQMTAEMLELATIIREHLGDKDRAAALLHQILASVDPTNQEALARYGDHFRERRDWRGLADLLAFAVDNAQDAGASPAELVRQLEEIAQVAELRLGDVERAIETWQRIRGLEPDNAKAGEALRRLMSQAKMWASLVGVLEQEAQAAQTPQQRAEALRRIAQVYRERQVNPRQAIALYEEVVQLCPDDRGALKALLGLYERDGDEAGVALTLRRQLDLDAQAMAAELGTPGEPPPSARDWPVSKRVERLTTLRRLAGMYDSLSDTEGVVFACSGVLDILPGDRDALDRMEKALEDSGDVARLEQTLEYHAAAATGPAERAKVLRRLARLAADRSDEVAAMERWEAVIAAAPSDRDALEALAALYERHERWRDLAAVLDRTLMARPGGRGGRDTRTDHKPDPAADPNSPGGRAHAERLKRYAVVLDDKLGDADRATRAWQKLLSMRPTDRDALAALARLHEEAGRFGDLADVLERQIPLYAKDEPERAARRALMRAALLERKLGAPAEAQKTLEALLDDIDPSNLDAHKALRRLYEAHGDFEAAVRIAEREMFLTEEPQEKIARGLEIGLLCRDRLGDPERALQAFERVLALQDDLEEALGAAADLYARIGDWDSHARVLERRVELVPEGRERRALMTRIAQVMAERMGDHKGAFQWYRRAHEHMPDAQTIADLRRAAEAYGLWRELAEVYEDERGRLSPDDRGGHARTADAEAYLGVCQELAAICERRLQNPQRAMNVLFDALSAQPGNRVLLAEAERIAREADRRPLWQLLIECLEVPMPTSDRGRRVDLHVRRAEIHEAHLDDPERAMEELLKAFAWQPERTDTHRAVYELAERSGAWNDAVAMESTLCEMATTTQARVAILRRRAQLIEERLGEPVRAFRTHLVAFLCAPEDADTVGHLWRLGRAIGPRYRKADQTPRTEPPAAYVHPPSAPVSRPAAARLHRADFSGDPTEELSINDLAALHVTVSGPMAAPTALTDPGSADGVPDPLGPEDTSTIQLDLNEIELADDDDELADTGGPYPRRPRHRTDPTIELRTEDLIQALGRDSMSDGAAPAENRSPSLPGVAPRQPPPVPRARPPAPPVRRKLVPLPAMPAHAYSGPWEELAVAYELLPAPSAQAKVQWLFRAAEVWENGAEDIGRAFDTLARALDASRDDAEPRARLHRLAQNHDAWDRLADLYESYAESARSRSAAIDMLMEVAEIRAQQGRARDSEAIYRRVLGMNPDRAQAREKLEALYRSEGRWVDLAAALEERTDPRLGSAAPPTERPALLRELAALYRDTLSRPHDAIDALLRLRQLEPEDVGVLRDLGELYGQVGRWSKVIETLTRICDVAEGTADARDALRVIAGIYERELELPDRAIDAYSQLVASWPDDEDAYAALDRLYSAYGKWRDLSDILRRRAALAREPAERAELLRRRADVLLTRLGAPEEAAAALRHARTIIAPDAPEAAGLADELIHALIKAKRAREAAAVLEGRIEALTAGASTDSGVRASAGEIAALLTRLATLRAEELGDKAGARAAIENALALVPHHPSALATLARITKGDQDPRAYAEARLREAAAATDREVKVAALLAAGATLRDLCGDIEGARAAYEQLLAVEPSHPEAIWSLAGLVEQGGDPNAAAELLERRLADESLEPGEVARIQTQLAALSRQAGVDAAADRHLVAALDADPTHLPAIIARADLLGESGRYADVEEFLREALPALDGVPSATLAELHLRLAVAYEALDRDDDAYQTLLAADRIHRNHLRVKLALGENRYRARRWREAALHLSALATHPDAAEYPAELAEGLYHAALAEIRSLRPDKARGLYERALVLKPNYAPALHALAEIAMEQGDFRKAADLLTRQATATDDPAERTKLFEALGDMALHTLRDAQRARVCFEAAVNAADPLDSKHIPLLDKLLRQQHAGGDPRGAARTAELMASFEADPGRRAARFTEAAEGYLGVGDDERALAAARLAVDADPHDLIAVTVLSELLLSRGEVDDAAGVLGRALSRDDDSDEVLAARKSQLWYRLGTARHSRGDVKGTVSALERSIALASDSDGAMSARRILLDLWKDDPARRPDLLEFRRVLAADSMDRADVLSFARALCGARHDDGGRAMLELSVVMGCNLVALDREFLARHPAYAMAPDESYHGVLTAAQRRRLIDDRPDADEPAPDAGGARTPDLGSGGDEGDGDSDDRDRGDGGGAADSAAWRADGVFEDRPDAPLAAVLTAVWEASKLLWAEPEESLARCGVEGAARVSATSGIPAVSMFPCIAAALSTPATVVYTSGAAAAPDVQVVCAAAPIVVLGPRLQRDGGLTDVEARFLLGRAAELTRPDRVIAAGLPRRDFTDLVSALVRLFGPERLRGVVPSSVTDPDVLRARDDRLRTSLPVKLRTRLESLLADAGAGDLDLDRYLSIVHRAADRAGLLVSGDIRAACAHAGARGPAGERETRHLLRLSLAPSYLQARADLGVGVRG